MALQALRLAQQADGAAGTALLVNGSAAGMV